MHVIVVVCAWTAGVGVAVPVCGHGLSPRAPDWSPHVCPSGSCGVFVLPLQMRSWSGVVGADPGGGGTASTGATTGRQCSYMGRQQQQQQQWASHAILPPCHLRSLDPVGKKGRGESGLRPTPNDFWVSAQTNCEWVCVEASYRACFHGGRTAVIPCIHDECLG